MQRYWYSSFWNDNSPLHDEAKRACSRLCQDYVRGTKRKREEYIGNDFINISSSAKSHIVAQEERMNYITNSKKND